MRSNDTSRRGFLHTCLALGGTAVATRNAAGAPASPTQGAPQDLPGELDVVSGFPDGGIGEQLGERETGRFGERREIVNRRGGSELATQGTMPEREIPGGFGRDREREPHQLGVVRLRGAGLRIDGDEVVAFSLAAGRVDRTDDEQLIADEPLIFSRRDDGADDFRENHKKGKGQRAKGKGEGKGERNKGGVV